MNISKRLKEISKFVGKDSKVIDIGCDHAYLPIYLIENGISKSAIAVDNKIGPLKNAQENIKKCGLENKIKTILSDGFKDVKNQDYDTIIISGMGGDTIKEILDFSLINPSASLILEPNNNQRELRLYLSLHSYKIIDEAFIRDGNHYYMIIEAIKSVDAIKYNELELTFGPINLINKEKELIKTIESRLSLLKISEKLAKNKEKIKQDIKFYEEALNYVTKGN